MEEEEDGSDEVGRGGGGATGPAVNCGDESDFCMVVGEQPRDRPGQESLQRVGDGEPCSLGEEDPRQRRRRESR